MTLVAQSLNVQLLTLRLLIPVDSTAAASPKWVALPSKWQSVIFTRSPNRNAIPLLAQFLNVTPDTVTSGPLSTTPSGQLTTEPCEIVTAFDPPSTYTPLSMQSVRSN